MDNKPLADDDLLLLAIGLVKSTRDGDALFMERVAVAFEALRLENYSGAGGGCGDGTFAHELTYAVHAYDETE